MSNDTVPPFYQLGRRIAVKIITGEHTRELTGEVMDTDSGWIAVKDESSDTLEWLNLDFVASIIVLDSVT